MILKGKQLNVTTRFTKYPTTWDGDKLHQLNLYGIPCKWTKARRYEL
jgi:hypothetical protein